MADDAERPTLAAFIRTHQQAILDEWERRARALSPARRLSTAEVRDHLPHVIERIAVMAEAFDHGAALPTEEPERHAVDRLEEGYDLPDVVREYSLLREIILDASERAGVPGIAELRVLNRVLDHATEVAVSRFAHASQRLLRAVDRISTEAVGSQGLDALLERLLKVIQEASPAVDEATILLIEGDRLRVRAAVGLLAERERGFSLAIGEGFSGAIAADGKPRLLRDAAHDPIIASAALRRSAIRALYGVPLIDGEVHGVAHIGSATAYEFSDEDMLLFRALANRAAALIVEERLRENERRVRAELEAVLESIPAGVYVGDAGGFKRVNRVGLALMGLAHAGELDGSLDEIARRADVRDPATGAPVRADALPFARALRGEPAESELRLTRSDSGEPIILRTQAAPIRVDGQVTGAVVVATDVTAQKRVEAELRREAEYRERFVGVLGHDLRTPVAAISMAANLLLRQSALPERATRMLLRILSSTERVERMIRDLLDFTRARAGGLPLEPVGMDLYPVAHAVVDELALAHPEREIELRGAGDTHGTWDRARMGQLLSNLVSNALHYSPRHSTVLVELQGDDAVVELRISNEGDPIPDAVVPHLFEPFRRGAASDARHEAGLGLGLFIVRSIVDAHRGTIHVDSTPERTTFTVRLPRNGSTIPRNG